MEKQLCIVKNKLGAPSDLLLNPELFFSLRGYDLHLKQF